VLGGVINEYYRAALADLTKPRSTTMRSVLKRYTLFAALLAFIPRSRHGALHLFITPARSCAGTAISSAAAGRQIQTEEAGATTDFRRAASTSAHLAFLARRRALRPSEEYRVHQLPMDFVPLRNIATRPSALRRAANATRLPAD
jgi:hypothetical protein